MGPKECGTLVRQQCKPIRYSNNLLKHLAPIWETGIHTWKSLVTIKHTSPTSYTYHIQSTDAILAKLPQGHRNSPKIQLRTAVETLRSTLIHPDETEHRKLPKDHTPKTTLVHPSWHEYIKYTDLPKHTPHSYANLTTT
jgi:hypothetical protein